MRSATGLLAGLLACVLLAGCTSMKVEELAPLNTVQSVDLKRYMGTWYVVGAIPAAEESNFHNWVATYELGKDGKIASEVTYRDGSFTSTVRTRSLLSTVVNKQTNAEWNQTLAPWGMGQGWPVEPEYLITYLADDYSKAVVARNSRDSVWILARTPQLAEADYGLLTHKIALMGYDVAKLQKVPQQWPATGR